VLDAEAALEQQRHWWVPDAFVSVVGGDAADRAVCASDAGDDRGEDVGEFGADHEQPFGVGLGRRDLQQRDEFAAAREGVLDQAVVAEFGQLFDADSRVSQRLHRGPGPERAVFLTGEITPFAVTARVFDPDPRAVFSHGAAAPIDASDGEGRAGCGVLRLTQQRCGLDSTLVHVPGQHRQHGQPLAGA
jgi:hypothetical protein